jgi:3,4-dihydroxy 2-butanone 4-phosphate synthase/GTP cyclohydrolase II
LLLLLLLLSNLDWAMVFTGLIQATQAIQHVSDDHKELLLDGRLPFWTDVCVGDSIAVDGVCLTVEVRTQDGNVLFRLSDETLAKTRLGLTRTHQLVNLERALRYGQHLGGHITSGHVHTTTTVQRIDARVLASEHDVWFHIPRGFPADALVFKDSICINGVSLTVAEVVPATRAFRVSLIRTTLKKTTLCHLAVGDVCNIEFNRHLSPLNGEAKNEQTKEDKDVTFMKLAMQEAERGRATTAPNPWVGCILVNDDATIIGRGHHAFAGDKHAEVVALEDAVAHGHDCRGATAYVTLEPCHKIGRQPPCDLALVNADIRRVVVGMLDPDVRTCGRGCALLREKGLEVTLGVCGQEIATSLAPYVWTRCTGLPFVIAKLAISANGYYASDVTKSITSATSRVHAHLHLRSLSQAIIVGSATVLSDNPYLTVRVPASSLPLWRIVVDGHGVCTGDELHILSDQGTAPTLIATTRRGATKEALAQWTRKGVAVYVEEEQDAEYVNVHHLLRHLVQHMGVLQVLVEGGADLEDIFFRHNLVNEFWVYRSANFLSGAGRTWTTLFESSSLTSFRLDRTLAMNSEPTSDTLQVFRKDPVVDAAATTAITATTVAESPPLTFTKFEEALARFVRGDLIIVMDDASRENEGDLIVRADRITKEQVAFMVRHTTGLVCAPMTEERANLLMLPRMVSTDACTDPHQTAFTVSCDSNDAETTTGVSAADRCRTLHALAAGSATSDTQLRRPGHIFPLIAREGGLLTRRGHTEAAVDLCKLAGVHPCVGAIAELTNDTGDMMRYDDCLAFSKQFNLPIIHLDQIVAALQPSPLPLPSIACLAQCDMFMRVADDALFRLLIFPSQLHPHAQHRVLWKDSKDKATSAAMVRIHSDCWTGDALGSLLCDCGEQLKTAVRRIADHPGCGMIVFPAAQEGRGIGLVDKVRAYDLMQQSHGKIDTYEANVRLGLAEDARSYAETMHLVRHLLPSPRRPALQLLTSNPFKVAAFQEAGFDVEIVPIHCRPSPRNTHYLRTKAERHGSDIQVQAQASEIDVGLETHHDSSSSSSSSTIPQIPPPPINKSHPGTFYASSATTKQHLAGKRICVIQAGWHRETSSVFLQLVRQELIALGAPETLIAWKHIVVPGCFEIPLALAREMRKPYEHSADCFVVVGALMKGATLHFELISEAVIHKLMDLQLETLLPVVNCILNVYNQEQMEDRFLGKTDMPKSIAATICELLREEK